MLNRTDEYFMGQALVEARKAFEEDEVPVGAIIVHEDKVIAKAHNQNETLKDPTAHAEMIAMTQAAAYLERRRLSGCTMYCTIEPCPMCAGALVLARIDRLVYGALDDKSGACGSLYDIVQDKRLNHRVSTTKGVLEKQCRDIIQRFFKEKRAGNEKGK